MTKYTVNGGRILRGDILISGAKNAVLPVLSATLINKGKTRIFNCPDISDVRITAQMLEELGCNVKFINRSHGNIIEIDATKATNTKIDTAKACRCRSSITFLGSLTTRFHEAEVAYPGGCIIGERPIDIHLSALRDMNIETTHDDKYIKTKLSRTDCNTEPTKHIYLKFPSVGATENSLMAAAGLEECVNIYNAATEPEIICLGNYLKALGTHIEGLGTSHIKVKGQRSYNIENVSFRIIPDRIEASTYLILAAGVGDSIKIHGCVPEHLHETIKVLKKMGVNIKEYKYTFNEEAQSTLEITESAIIKKLKAPEIIIADAYPAFPTDAQSLMLPLLSIASGDTFIIDKIFPKRFNAADELIKTGAKIQHREFGIKIKGRHHLKGSTLYSHDLRSGAAMIIAGTLAKGQSIVLDEDYIKRGYDDITVKLQALGADITEIPCSP